MEWLTGLSAIDWVKLASSLGIAGILAGVSKSATDHWLSQRKDRTAYRRAKIKEWRQAIHDTEWADLGNTPAYSELRRYVRKDIIKDVEHPRMVIFPGGRGGDPRQQMLLDEIGRLEEKWKII